MNLMSDPIIVLSIIIRIFAGTAAYLTVVRKLLQERRRIPERFKRDNAMLIASVSTFILTCFGTAAFQACRLSLVPNCSSVLALDIVSLFNSASLLAAYLVMHAITSAKRETDKQYDKRRGVKEHG